VIANPRCAPRDDTRTRESPGVPIVRLVEHLLADPTPGRSMDREARQHARAHDSLAECDGASEHLAAWMAAS
jgi:hypothetical protein